MDHFATSQSILYFWKRRTLYIGQYPKLSPVTQGAASLLVGIDGPVNITNIRTGDIVRATSFLIPAGMTVMIDSGGGRVGNCYLDPCNEDFFQLKQIMKKHVAGIYSECVRESRQVTVLRKMLYQQPCHTEALILLEDELFPSIVEAPMRAKIDGRVIEIIGIIKSDPTTSCSNKILAEKINIEAGTLQKLFKATTGIPIRRFRLWHRLFVTATLLSFGRSITDAALEAGFSDASHFNHVLKDMLGMTPSSILNLAKETTIRVADPLPMNQVSAVR